MTKYGVQAANAPECRGESIEADRLLDDWLGDEAEIDWFPEAAGTTGRQEVAERVGQGRRYGPAFVDDLGGPASEDARIVRRRRTAALLALLAVVAVVAVSVGVLTGSNRSGSQPTTPVTTTTPASTTTTAPATTPTQSGAQTATAPALAIALPAAATIRIGDSGTAVKKLQQALNKLGFDAGSVDGIFGLITENAVVSFQEARGLANDGIVGPKTVGKINAGLASRPTG